MQAFQRRRGLRNDGIVGATTWERLVEAGWRLGDRVLSTTAPLLKGDDVAELQERLAALGFDPGRVDGIYGAATRAAVAGFQRDAGMSPDGVAGPAMLAELRRLAVRHPRAILVNEVKERTARRTGLASLDGVAVAVAVSEGLGPLADALAAELVSRGAEAHLVHDDAEHEVATAANASTARCLLVVRLDPGATGATALYFASDRSESPTGRRLAESVAQAAGRALGVDTKIRGMTLPVLRETRMPATVVEVGLLERVLERAGPLAEGLAGAIEGWAQPEA